MGWTSRYLAKQDERYVTVSLVLNMTPVSKENLILKLVTSFKWNVIYKNKTTEVFFSLEITYQPLN